MFDGGLSEVGVAILRLNQVVSADDLVFKLFYLSYLVHQLRFNLESVLTARLHLVRAKSLHFVSGILLELLILFNIKKGFIKFTFILTQILLQRRPLAL